MSFLREVLWSGTTAAIASTAAAAVAARMEGQAAVAPINAVSHVLWGDAAASHDEVSGRYTLTGLATNHGACLFWAACYHAGRPAFPAVPWGAAACSAAVTATAYAVDYHVVPRRLTPGYELRLPPRGLALIYAAIALALPLRELFARSRR